jgi:gliding motility-associated protein GldM
MGAKNCPETPRQKMINMMYIVLTAMLAINVAHQVLEAFRVVDKSLLQTIKAVDMQNQQIYSSFEQAYSENPNKVREWKQKADQLKEKSAELTSYVNKVKDDVVSYSGVEKLAPGEEKDEESYYHVNSNGDTVKIKKEDDLNAPSEFMITQKNATELKNKIEEYRNFIVSLVDGNDDLTQTILNELNTDNPDKKSEGEGNFKTWESEHFENKPLIAVMTLLSKIQIDVKNAEQILQLELLMQMDM